MPSLVSDTFARKSTASAPPPGNPPYLDCYLYYDSSTYRTWQYHFIYTDGVCSNEKWKADYNYYQEHSKDLNIDNVKINKPDPTKNWIEFVVHIPWDN